MASPPQDVPPDLFCGGGYVVRKIGNRITYRIERLSPALSPSGLSASLVYFVPRGGVFRGASHHEHTTRTHHHARVAEKFHPTFHLHKCIVPTYNLRERTDDSQADVTSSQCLFSYINHEGITLVGKGNGVLPLRFRTQYLSRC